ncbi:PREDICTED: uncharacterized protein LOC105148224 [Acromyrmex echinatior]|uniref:uncharacterized protein LOC105148224 n=1 Tax=Acromyrmex echinatior TaxID=103372 RepID=UPI000580EEE9|nr:PREDICTED: uncharacterized protein LOC105148224 [Acromyrmex echinatior]
MQRNDGSDSQFDGRAFASMMRGLRGGNSSSRCLLLPVADTGCYSATTTFNEVASQLGNSARQTDVSSRLLIGTDTSTDNNVTDNGKSSAMASVQILFGFSNLLLSVRFVFLRKHLYFVF